MTTAVSTIAQMQSAGKENKSCYPLTMQSPLRPNKAEDSFPTTGGTGPFRPFHNRWGVLGL